MMILKNKIAISVILIIGVFALIPTAFSQNIINADPVTKGCPTDGTWVLVVGDKCYKKGSPELLNRVIGMSEVRNPIGGPDGSGCIEGFHFVINKCYKNDSPQFDNILKQAANIRKVEKAAENIKTIGIEPYKSIIPIPCQNISGISNVNCAESYSAPGSYVLRIYQFALLLVGMAAFGQIVFGGLEYILAAGSFAKIDSAKKRIWDALSGLLLLLGAYFVLFNINPDLVSLRDPILETIDTRKLAEQAKQNLVDSANSFTGDGSSSSGGTLCRRTVNYGVTINTNIKFEGIQFMDDDDTVTQLAEPKEIPQIPQSSCFECQPNSSKDSSGVCQCNSGYTQEGNQCLLPKF